MLAKHEIGAAMAFDADYIVTGTTKEVIKQFGNAVTPPTMEWIIGQCVAALMGEVA
jgi:DNA (cytosine-5)-methyltransferase 1